MHTLKLPARFWDDHYDRCAEHPGHREELRRTRREVVVELDEAALANLRSDAAYYGRGGLDDAPRGVVLSAKATLARL